MGGDDGKAVVCGGGDDKVGYKCENYSKYQDSFLLCVTI